jgi:serine/threonine protein kinase
MHSKDLFHRDIKPENLLLDSAQNVLLCDFGWAVSGLKTPHRTFCGTYEYMAPEVLYGLPYDCRVDFWSMGVLLF